MGIRAMKFDLFVLKALEKKGYKLESLMELDDAELESLNLSDKIINNIKEYKLRGGKTSAQVAMQIAELMERDSETNMSKEEVHKVFEIEVSDIKEDVPQEYIDKIESNESSDEVEVLRTISNPDDIKAIKDALKTKELRSFSAYTKHLQKEVPAAILEAVESTTINDLIDERINEIKESSTK